jgi:hypothetical protein
MIPGELEVYLYIALLHFFFCVTCLVAWRLRMYGRLFSTRVSNY